MLRYVTNLGEDNEWGYDVFEDDGGNEYVLTGHFIDFPGHHIADEEANAIATELGAK